MFVIVPNLMDRTKPVVDDALVRAKTDALAV